MRQPSIEETIADAIALQGWTVVPNFLESADVAQLAAEARALRAAGELHRAGIGKGNEYSINDDIRGDFIAWIEETQASPTQLAYLARLESLRLHVNYALFLGLFDLEAQIAIYPPGAYYRKHVDQFQQENQRTLSCVLYLNQEWQPEDGGQLRLYLDGEREDRYQDIQPTGGTLAVFLSARFWHEVLPAKRDRLSITGWFRKRTDNPLEMV